ncbi:Threonine/homoserine/homoserine lactone efflux protein [Ekhidna lutea]|uniref:Threonine/homoserine/homoserine lactone efflux protein n=1 Tax=Ekhidna lutea TaxID=447679 RepID=A0A239L1W5_EKHLU|nr:LysE family transporter [Ekhidna lutea]SNT24441.1 Threonine/homoserine/homoserine lactone efflux protein [Ekhidna lutea]
MPPIINGLIFGLIFLFALGPAFFALIQTSIQQGFKKAIFMAIGISTSDVFYVVLVLLGMAKALETDDFKIWMGIFGVVMLGAYAVYSWFKVPKVHNDDTMMKESSLARQFAKGLFLNGLNPFIIVSWATWVSAIAINFEYSFNEQLQFFGGMLITILTMDITKAFIAHRLKHLVTVKFVRRMNRTVAIILILFTFQILYFLITNYA